MRIENRKLHYSFRLYVVCDGKRVIGKGGAQILEGIDRLGSLMATAKELKMSYRFVWEYLRRMEHSFGKQVIVTRRGTTLHARNKGGGGTNLTPFARTILNEYRVTEERLRKQLRQA